MQPVESNVLHEFRQQLPPDVDSSWLLSTSQFVFLSTLNHKVKKPFTLQMGSPVSMHAKEKPLPVKKVVAPPPTTEAEPQAVRGKKKEKKQMTLEEAIEAAETAERKALEPDPVQIEDDYMNKPLTGILGKEKEEGLIMVAYDPETGPVVLEDLDIIEGKKDILTITMDYIYHK